MATPNLSEITATTLRNRSGMLADNVTNNNGLLTKLKARGKIRTFSGGEDIVQELSFQENSTFKYYSGYELLNVAPTEVLSAANYDMKQAAVAVTISGRERLQNSSKEKIIDLLEGRIGVAEATMANQLSVGIYSNGTGDGGKQITGLGAQVPKSPSTGTVGGINRATYSFWRNAALPSAAAATTQSNILSQMENLWLACMRGSDVPDLIPMGNTAYAHLWNALQAQQRFTTSHGDMAKAGWTSLMFNSAEAIADGGIGGAAGASDIFMLNCDYIHWRPHRDRNMVPLDLRTSVDQDAMVRLIAFAGNLTMSGGKFQGRVNNT